MKKADWGFPPEGAGILNNKILAHHRMGKIFPLAGT